MWPLYFFPLPLCSFQPHFLSPFPSLISLQTTGLLSSSLVTISRLFALPGRRQPHGSLQHSLQDLLKCHLLKPPYIKQPSLFHYSLVLLFFPCHYHIWHITYSIPDSPNSINLGVNRTQMDFMKISNTKPWKIPQYLEIE